jgi:ABC-type phosphate transport system ATPase subunit
MFLRGRVGDSGLLKSTGEGGVTKREGERRAWGRHEVINLPMRGTERITLQDINLHISPNQATALMRPVGLRQSTFVRCLNRMHETNPIARYWHCASESRHLRRRATGLNPARRRYFNVNPFPTMSIDNVASGLGSTATQSPCPR